MEKYLTAIIDIIKGILKSKTTKVVGRILGILGVYVIATEVDIVANALRIFWQDNRDRVLFFRNRVFCSLLLALALIIFGLALAIPNITGLGFLLAIIVLMVAWAPVGTALYILGINNKVYVPAIKVAAGWLAFFGFMAMMLPEVFQSFRLILLICLVGFIFSGLGVNNSRFMKNLAIAVTIFFCVFSVAVYAFPAVSDWKDGRRDQINSLVNVDATLSQRSKIAHQAEATKNYVKAKRNTPLLKFAFDKKGNAINYAKMYENGVCQKLLKDSIALEIGLRKDVVIFNDQAFFEIRMKDEDGLFIGTEPIYICATDVVQISELPSEGNISNSASNPNPTSDFGRTNGHFGAGTHSFILKHKGDHSGKIIIDGLHYNIKDFPTKRSFSINYADGFSAIVPAGDTGIIHDMPEGEIIFDVEAMYDNQNFVIKVN